tara:strand:+ start:23022 stop:24794 length:1773 start_codon:yes stop_codon:yes gene_type:complete
MTLNRQERKLLHQKSNQPTLGSGVPNSREGNEGDVAYRNIKGSGVVQFLKTNNEWVAISSSGEMPKARTPVSNRQSVSGGVGQHGSLTGLGTDHHTQYLLVSGTRAMSGDLNMGSQSITSVNSVTASGTVQAEQLTSTDDAQIGDDLTVFGDITVDGEAKLDKTTIDTADGKFTASGANNIELTTTGANDIDLTSGQNLDVGVGVDYELDVTRTCDWNTATTDWDNSNTFTLTSVGDVTIETSGADTAKTILLFNDNNNASAFRGIHLKTDSGSVGSSQNSIFLECDNRSSKGGGDGIDIRSEDGILIRAEDPTTGTASNIQIRATNHIDLQGGTASISPTGDSITRVKVHGITEIVQLYRPSGSSITTNLETITSPFGGSPETGHTEFEAINTQHLLRAITYKTSTSVAWETDTTCHVTSGSPTVTHDANIRILKGQKVTGTGIPANTFVGGTVTSTEFTLKNSSDVDVNATAGDGSEITLQFFNPSAIEEDNRIGIVNKDNDDNVLGTIWQITVYYTCSSSKKNLQIFYLYFTSSSSFDIHTSVEDLHSTAAGVLNWDSNQGITWQNEDTQDATVRASALRIQSGNDF